MCQNLKPWQSKKCQKLSFPQPSSLFNHRKDRFFARNQTIFREILWHKCRAVVRELAGSALRFQKRGQNEKCSFSGWGQFLQSSCRSTSEFVISRVAKPRVIWHIHECSCKSFAKIVPIQKNYIVGQRVGFCNGQQALHVYSIANFVASWHK